VGKIMGGKKSGRKKFRIPVTPNGDATAFVNTSLRT